MTDNNLISDAFKSFSSEAPQHAEAWSNLVQSLAKASALDHKTQHLAYVAVLAVLRRSNGIPFHVKAAKNSGATREEVISAILLGLPAVGHVVTEVLPGALSVYDET